MELITDNMLAAFATGVSTLQEDKLVMNEMANSEEFADLLNMIDEIDSIDCIDELRNEFNDSIDENFNFNDFKINIK